MGTVVRLRSAIRTHDRYADRRTYALAVRLARAEWHRALRFGDPDAQDTAWAVYQGMLQALDEVSQA